MTTSWKNNQDPEEKKVAAAIELLRKTMLVPDYATFDKLTSAYLSYGHSTGLVEDKQTCIQSMVSGKFKFLTLTFSEQSITITKDIAIVRNTFFADTHDEGKEPGTANIKVLMIWRKENGQWHLLARQATKFPPVTVNK